MAVKLETLLSRSTKNMGSGINPVVKESALEVIRQAYHEGLYVQITSGYRSYAEQNRLYAQGRTDTSKPIVTNAEGGKSNHNYGLAVDFVIMSEDGSRALWTVNDQWRRVAEIAKKLGFAWGGDWKSFKDFPHLEMMGGMTLKDLQEGKRPKLVSKVPQSDSADRKLTLGEKGPNVKILNKKLNQLEYTRKTNDVFDGYTLRALKAFQEDYDLEVDGVYTKEVGKRMDEAIAELENLYDIAIVPKKNKNTYRLAKIVDTTNKKLIRQLIREGYLLIEGPYD
ncbi:M15 family metallopeptidase [Peribacillus alkalitolerans]|uniref:M15 family metallopeptidase n=1 Tax=Peribacillus alkalitolerans TaxID=1550385 RepID=UPI0013D4605C|nr:M15 family metallopeptidase [Peribacillus alkalitolerans]